MNLTKDVYDLYTENSKTLLQEIKKIYINGEICLLYDWEEDLILFKCQFYISFDSQNHSCVLYTFPPRNK